MLVIKKFWVQLTSIVLFTNILQNKCCVPQNKETHTGLVQYEGERMMTEFSFLHALEEEEYKNVKPMLNSYMLQC